MQPNQFHKVTKLPIGLGMGKLEYEISACQMLNRYIETDKPFDEPLDAEYAYTSQMSAEGWLTDHGDNKYTFTRRLLGLLWAEYGKD